MWLSFINSIIISNRLILRPPFPRIVDVEGALLNCILDDISERQKLEAFILSWEQPEGGFSFSQLTPPTREDTYFALRSFNTLMTNYSNIKTNDYTRNLLVIDHSSSRHLYQILYLLNTLQLSGCQHAIKKLVENRSISSMNSFKEIYYHLLLKLRLRLEIDSEEITAVSSCSISELKYISDICRQVILMNKMNISFDKSKYSHWILHDQNYDGGFGFLHQTTSFLENQYYAFRALDELNSVPLRLEKSEAFIFSCRTGAGGFGRQIRSLATLEATYHAIESLRILENMKK